MVDPYFFVVWQPFLLWHSPFFSSAAWWLLFLFQIGLSTAWGNKRQCFRLGGSSGSTTAGFIGWRPRGLLCGTYGTLRRCCSELSLYDQWIWEEATRNCRHECWWNFHLSLHVTSFLRVFVFLFWGRRRSCHIQPLDVWRIYSGSWGLHWLDTVLVSVL